MTDLMQGTLDLLILRPAPGPLHGGTARRIRQIWQEVLRGNHGSLYPVLHRLQQQEVITATSPAGSPVRRWHKRLR